VSGRKKDPHIMSLTGHKGGKAVLSLLLKKKRSNGGFEGCFFFSKQAKASVNTKTDSEKLVSIREKTSEQGKGPGVGIVSRERLRCLCTGGGGL